MQFSHFSTVRWLYHRSALTVFRIMARSFSAVINFHSRENRPQSDGICVANHTSPIDVVILSCDRAFALVTASSMLVLGLSSSVFTVWDDGSLGEARKKILNVCHNISLDLFFLRGGLHAVSVLAGKSTMLEGIY